MKQISLPEYKALEDALNETTLKLHPSQVHGLICGILCGNPKSSVQWEEIVTGDKKAAVTQPILTDLYQSTTKQLAEFLFEFNLVMPDDDEKLQLKAEALTLWCQGFLTGLKLAQVQIIDRAPGEMTEAINDIIEIAKMNYEEVVQSEEDEAAYVELIEYVRVAVILIYQTIREDQEVGKVASSSNHLH